jgi:hypothetical protein
MYVSCVCVINNRWYIQGSAAVKGDGLVEGMDWLAKTINATKKK